MRSYQTELYSSDHSVFGSNLLPLRSLNEYKVHDNAPGQVS